ncbi:MAG: hypothetical protein FWC43_10370 [Planctomycetaceae bacterium]|nr:hypothetical protein [Planctomycetaceae bacterium]
MKQTAGKRQQTADSRQQTAENIILPSAVCRLPSVVCRLPSVVCCLPSVVCRLICCLFLVCSLPPVAVAQVETPRGRIELLKEHFSASKRVSNTKYAAIAVCVVVGAVTALVFAERYYRKRNTKNGFYSQNRLFRELCQSHELTKDQQAILRKIAKELQLDNPATLFIEPKHLELALSEQVVQYPQDAILQITNELFGHEVVPDEAEGESSWFAWTKVIDNPEADQLKKVQKNKDDERDDSGPFTAPSQTQQWDPSFWQDIHRAINGQISEKNDPTSPQAPMDQSPPVKSQEQAGKEKAGYKPRYPETQDVPVHQEISSKTGDSQTIPQKIPQSLGAKILSSMLYSVSDVTNELAYSSIRNHLTRTLSLSPPVLGEVKQRSLVTASGSAIPLDEMMVSPQKQFQQPDTQTQMGAKAAARQLERKSIDLKPPKPLLIE